MYPGAKLDRASTDEAKAAAAAEPEVEVTVYTTSAPFDKFYGFFAKNGREFKVIGSRMRKLPNGQDLRDAFFILDGAENLAVSKRWVKLQRPYLGQYGLVDHGQVHLGDRHCTCCQRLSDQRRGRRGIRGKREEQPTRHDPYQPQPSVNRRVEHVQRSFLQRKIRATQGQDFSD